MTCKSCPSRKFCWDKGNCESCEFGKAFERCNKKINKLKAKNKALVTENKELKNRLDIILKHDF